MWNISKRAACACAHAVDHAKFKTKKIYSQVILVNYSKICTNENFPLYDILRIMTIWKICQAFPRLPPWLLRFYQRCRALFINTQDISNSCKSCWNCYSLVQHVKHPQVLLSLPLTPTMPTKSFTSLREPFSHLHNNYQMSTRQALSCINSQHGCWSCTTLPDPSSN